jgi:replicative DNA helicase
MALLGAMLLNPKVTSDVIGVVRGAEDFYAEAHRAIFKTLLEVYDRNPDADLVPILDALRDRGQLELIGGQAYLEKLAGETPSSAGAVHYARIVSEKAKLRKLVEAAEQILHDALHVGQLGPDGAREVLDRAETMVFEIAQEDQKADPQLLGDLLQKEVERIEAAEGLGISGVPTGFPDLDRLTSGLQPGEMVVLAARPSMGKTALALNMAEQIARGGRTRWGGQAKGPDIGVGFFSLEMTRTAVTLRFLSAMSGFDSQSLRGGRRFNPAEWQRLTDASEELRGCRVFIDDTPGLSVMALRARARRMVAQHGVRVIMIDYLQLLSAPGSSRESRQVEVSAISRGLKALARELDIPIVCLSQLNRASEQREGNRPRMSDLRESGSIEQDADVVMLLHREDYYHAGNEEWAANNPDKVGTAELIIAKQRNGPTDVVRLTWDTETTRFSSYAPGGGSSFTPRRSADEPDWGRRPDVQIRPAFSPPAKTGPVEGFRDGGGPEHGDDEAATPF